MYSPTFTITQYILSYIVKCELALERIRTTPLPDTYFTEVYEKLRAEDIDKLGELIGSSIGYSKALQIQRGKVLPTGKAKDRILTNYRSVQDFINVYTASSFYRPSSELMIHLNKLLGKSLVEEWEIGKLRTFSEKPNDIHDNWYKLRDFFPNLKPKRHLDELFLWINTPKNVPHKLIQLAVLLYEIMDKAPFNALNQITAITTISILAKEYGYNHRNLIPFAKAINQISEEIISAFKICKSKKDLTIFIETLLYSLALTSTEVSTLIKNTYDNRVKKYSKLNESLNPRQVKILETMEKERRITRHDYSKLMGVSFMTAFRDLQELLDMKYIQQKGVGRGTYYILSEKIKADETNKPKVGKTLRTFD
ncbi:MAG: hypothetical protein UT34_C0001G0092 [candidate division WS6 bacterium GW2011_GWF2_39_15]|uniref:HTH deoR-type domain-containing protein n=1 Tax=candidate division WS6 bacterium GW2011_GWF2_39_15 TaxID=1619100 RepID=A0A0G0QWN0_9BACT|nr:MAG: hypothetical protein UT34_C0001G0092 [candidate division WS6 bacterium GW2011_GWF2_39_15]